MILEMRDSSDFETSEHSESPAKRRRRRKGSASGGEGTSANEVGTAISKSASIIAEALQASEEREEKRHRELLSMHERRLRIEESKTEIGKALMGSLMPSTSLPIPSMPWRNTTTTNPLLDPK